MIYKTTVKKREQDKRYRSSAKGKISSYYNRIKSRSLRKGLEFTLTKDWFYDRVHNGRCELTGLRFNREGTYGDPFLMSVDRKDPTKGYTIENCRTVLFGINNLKSAGTDMDVERIVLAYIKYNKLSLEGT